MSVRGTLFSTNFLSGKVGSTGRLRHMYYQLWRMKLKLNVLFKLTLFSTDKEDRLVSLEVIGK